MEYTLVTGACGGLGGAFVDCLAARGEALFLTGRSAAKLQTLAASLRERYPALAVETCACDLSDSASREALFAYADEKRMRFSRLVYVAGVDIQKAAEAYTEAKIVLQARVNLEGAVSLARGVFLRRGEGCELLAVGSMSAGCPMPYFALYSATKKGLEQFWVALRTEVKGRAKATVVLPGGIPTREDIIENIKTHGWFGRVSALPPAKVAAASLKAVARNKRKKVIGGWNKFLYVLEHLVPLPIRLRVIAKIWGKTQKDAF